MGSHLAPDSPGQSGGPAGTLLARSSITATMSAETSHRTTIIGTSTAAAKRLDIVHSEFKACPPDDMLEINVAA